MKKIIVLISFLAAFICGFSQTGFVNTTTQGSANTFNKALGSYGSDSGYIVTKLGDTINLHKIAFYDGTSGKGYGLIGFNGYLFYRVGNAWVRVAAGGEVGAVLSNGFGINSFSYNGGSTATVTADSANLYARLLLRDNRFSSINTFDNSGFPVVIDGGSVTAFNGAQHTELYYGGLNKVGDWLYFQGDPGTSYGIGFYTHGLERLDILNSGQLKNSFVAGSGNGVLIASSNGSILRGTPGTDYAPAFTVTYPVLYSSNIIGVDTGRGTTQLATGGSLNKVRDSLQANISAGSVASIGNFSNTSTAKGLDLTSNVLTLHAADTTNPGGVSTGAQIFSGAKWYWQNNSNEYMFKNSWLGNNTASFWNTNFSGVSAIRFLDVLGHEKGAFGFMNDTTNTGPSFPFNGSVFIETNRYLFGPYNNPSSIQNQTLAPVPFRIITTGYISASNGFSFYRRFEVDSTGHLYITKLTDGSNAWDFNQNTGNAVFSGSLTLANPASSTTTAKFVIDESGVLKTRTLAQVKTDLGVPTATFTSTRVLYGDGTSTPATSSTFLYDGAQLIVGGTTNSVGGAQRAVAAESGTNITYIMNDGTNGYAGTVSNQKFGLMANGTARVWIDQNYHVGFGGITTPTAWVHLGAGTTAANTAPLKFTTGTLLSSTEAGAVEFVTDKYYATITTGAARKEFTLNDAALTSGRVPFSTTNGRLTDNSSFTFDGTTQTMPALNLSTAPTTSAGTYDILTRNTSTGVVEKISSSTLPQYWSRSSTTLSPTTAGDNTAVNGLATAFSAKTANYTLVSSDHTITADASSGSVTVTLPTTGVSTGQIFIIKKINTSNSVILDPNGAATIDGASTYTWGCQYGCVTVQFDGTNYIIINAYGVTSCL